MMCTRTHRRFAVALLAAGLVLPAASAGQTEVDTVPEPAGYRMEAYRAPVPRSLAGATSVLTTDGAKALFDAGAVLIDVYPQAPKPPNLPAHTVWRDPKHRSIAGAHWLPNVGHGVISAETEAYFTRHLERLTAADRSKPLVFFCLRDCWMSWNAAKRALAMGYRQVHWFPDGSDGWDDHGYTLADLTPVM